MRRDKCIECGTRITGRADKKYCNEACKNAYNNSKNRKKNSLIYQVNQKLKKNHRILSHLCENQTKTKVSEKQLLSKGFHFEVFTYSKPSTTGIVYFIYDKSYTKTDTGEDYILIA